MQNQIWKATLSPQTGEQSISFPAGSEIMTADVDPTGLPCVWAMVDTSQSLITFRIWLFWTGESIHQVGNVYLGSFSISGLVYHAFTDVI